MIVETIIIIINVVLTAVFAKFAAKALHIRSRCSKCCDIEIDNNNSE